MSAQNLARLLGSRRALLIGAPLTPAERSLHAQLQRSAGALQQADTDAEMQALAAEPDDDRLAVVFAPALLDAALIDTLARNGCRGIVWAHDTPVPPALLQAARPHQLRFIGPRSAGFFQSGGLTAGAFARVPQRGGIALITQSGSIAAAAVDWAIGRGIGLSWAISTGAEADVDLADCLDAAALDPATRAVILQVGRIRGGRKFISAARACARLKPVVVLQSRVGGREGLSGPDPVRSAAFARAGLVECATLDGLFDALAAMARLPERREARVLTLGNGAGMCALGVDAVLQHGLGLWPCDDETFAAVHTLATRARRLEGALDIGSLEPATLAEVCRLLLARDSLDYLLLMHSPSLEAAHAPYVEALVAAQLGPRLVTIWLGLETAVPAMRRAGEAGLNTFGTADRAARAIHYRWLHQRTRELLMQTPPHRERRDFHQGDAHLELLAALAGDDRALSQDAVHRVLDDYGIAPLGGTAIGGRFELRIRRHHELGSYLDVTTYGTLLHSATAIAFPPLDPLLVQRMIEAMQISLTPPIQAALARELLALAQLALDQPAVSALRVSLRPDPQGVLRRDAAAEIELDANPPPAALRLILPPYPEQLRRPIVLRDGSRYRVRPILPEDEPALIKLLESLRPEDLRLRFFTMIRHFSHEMAARMTQIDYDRELVLAVETDDAEARFCAMAHLVLEPYGDRAEFAILVDHHHTGHGLGRRLMDELLNYARSRGLHIVYGDVLDENESMLALARRLGFKVRYHPEERGARRVEIDLRRVVAAEAPHPRLDTLRSD